MAKLDPKLLRKVSQSELIAAAKTIGVKNAEKVSKENLIPAFLDAVQAVPEAEVEGLDDGVIKMNNFLLQTFDLADEPESTKKEGGEKTMAKETKKAEKKAEKKATKKNGYSRIQAFCDTVKAKKSGKMDALIEAADQKYASKGGTTNTKESAWNCNLGIRFLVGMGIASLEEGSFKLL